MERALFDAPVPSAAGDVMPPQCVCGGKRFIEIPARDQMSFLARSTEDFVPADAQVRVIDEIIEQLDFAAFERRYPGGGRPAFPPQFVAKLIIYGMCVRVLSGRELSRRLERDLHFMWLAHEQRVDHEVLSDFRRKFRGEIKALFQQTVQLGLALGLVSLECLAIDGTKLAAAARRRALNQAELQQALAKLDEHIDQLLAEAEALDAADDAALGALRGDEVPQALASAQARREKLAALLPLTAAQPDERISLTDPQAPVQKTPDGKRPGYNAQIAVDDKVGFIVAADVTCEQNDTQQFAPMTEQALENLPRPPDVLVADTGYHSAEALEYLAEHRELNGYINQQAVGTPGLYGQQDFVYDAATDTYQCPAGRPLTFRNETTLHDKVCRVYRVGHSCKDCAQRGQCFTGKLCYRKLTVLPHGHLVVAMRRRVQTDEGQAALRKRSATVERNFGTIKAALGLRQFLTRGLDAAGVEFRLAVIAVNVRKLAAWIAEHGWTLAPTAAG